MLSAVRPIEPFWLQSLCNKNVASQVCGLGYCLLLPNRVLHCKDSVKQSLGAQIMHKEYCTTPLTGTTVAYLSLQHTTLPNVPSPSVRRISSRSGRRKEGERSSLQATLCVPYSLFGRSYPECAFIACSKGHHLLPRHTCVLLYYYAARNSLQTAHMPRGAGQDSHESLRLAHRANCWVCYKPMATRSPHLNKTIKLNDIKLGTGQGRLLGMDH